MRLLRNALNIKMARLNSDMHSLFNYEVLKLLFAKEIFTISDFVSTDIKQLSSITFLPYKEILAARKYIIHKHSAVIKTGVDYHNYLLRNVALIETGIKSFDQSFNGGLMTDHIYEICGFPAMGKTQFCLTLAKNIAQNQQQIVYFIDTKRDFSGTKIYDMLNSNKGLTEVSIGDIMNRILVKCITTKHDLLNSLQGIKTEIESKLLSHEVRVIIIDSLPPLFYQTIDHTINNGVMNHIINTMRFMAKQFHLVFVITNVITKWYDIGSENEPAHESPGLGKYWQNIPSTRFFINKLNNLFEMSIVKSTNMKSGLKCTIHIADDEGMF